VKAAKTNAAINATTAIAIRARKKWVMRGDAGIAISFDREKMPRQLRRPYSLEYAVGLDSEAQSYFG
jgi:hypothetical protein